MFNWEGAELPGYRFGIAPGTGLDGLEGIPAGTQFAFYGEWLYRRTCRYDLTPPGLPRPIYVDLELLEDEETRFGLTRPEGCKRRRESSPLIFDRDRDAWPRAPGTLVGMTDARRLSDVAVRGTPLGDPRAIGGRPTLVLDDLRPARAVRRDPRRKLGRDLLGQPAHR